MAVSTGRQRFALIEGAVAGARRAMEQAKRDVQANAKSRTAGGDSLAAAVHYRVRPNIASVTVTLSCDHPGASFVDLGTSTPITAPGGKRMAVFARTGGPVVFARAVRGQRATHFFSDVADSLAARVAREVGVK